MKTRIATAIFGVLLATAAAAAYAQTAVMVRAPAADSEEPTSMPDYCSELDVNCVLDTGMPRWRVIGASESETPGTPTTVPGAGIGATAGGETMGGSPSPLSGGSSSGFRGLR